MRRKVLSRLIALAGVCLFAITLAAPVRAGVFNPETFTLANGLEVVVVPNHRVPAVMHMVWYRVGSADEPPGKSGIAHFLEHLMFKGTKTVPPGEFSKIVARNGGRANAFTSTDYTGYFQKVAADRLGLAMKLEADRMANLVLARNHVDSEREVVREERRSRTDNDPASLLHERMNAVLFLTHPYRHPIIGWDHEIKGLTQKDAADFYKRWYAPNNAVLILVGDVTAAQARPLAEKTFGKIARRAIPLRQRPQEVPSLAARRIEMFDPRVKQPAWVRTYQAPSYVAGDKQHAYALQVLATLLGDGLTSRLYRSLVIEGKQAVYAGVGYEPEAVDLGSFQLYASPQSNVSLETVEKAMEAEIARLLKDGVSAEEVERAKKRLRANVVYARDSLYLAAQAIGTAFSIGQSVADVEAWPEHIAGVTVEQVNAAARAVFVDKNSVTGLLRPEEADPS